MRWRGGRESSNVEDRRGLSLGGGAGLGCGGLLLLLIISFITGVNPLELLNQVQEQQPQGGGYSQTDRTSPGQNDEMSEFVRVVLASTEDTWNQIFQQMGRRYEEPKLVLFSDQVGSACGFSSSATGPFYCPGDEKVYLDLSFFRELDRRFGAPGDFAQAYVIAHEVGHHVQNLLGISEKVHSRQEQSGQAEANALSVRLELQADCLAGVWGSYANRNQHLLETGDVEEGLNAAAAIGDDVLQRRAGGRVVPESWTHGSSRMRVEWFRRGLQSGSPSVCDTFAAGSVME
jgi:predicted metalloprotease